VVRHLYNKIRDLVHLASSKGYVLITSKQSVVAGHFKPSELFEAIHHLKLIRTNVKDTLSKLEEEVKKNGRD